MKSCSRRYRSLLAVVLTLLALPALRCGGEGSETGVTLSSGTVALLRAANDQTAALDVAIETAAADPTKEEMLGAMHRQLGAILTPRDVQIIVQQWEALNRAWADGARFEMSPGFDELLPRLEDVPYIGELGTRQASATSGAIAGALLPGARTAGATQVDVSPAQCGERCLRHLYTKVLQDLNLPALWSGLDLIGAGASVFLSGNKSGNLLGKCETIDSGQCTFDRLASALSSWGASTQWLKSDVLGVGTLTRILAYIATVDAVASDGAAHMKSCLKRQSEQCQTFEPDDPGVGSGDTDTDTDGDTETGSDTGTDTGSDTDTDTDSDTGTDADSDTDTDTGSDTGTDADSDADTDTDTGTDTGSDTDTGTDTGSDTDTGTDTGSDTDTGTDTGSDTDTGTDTDTDTDTGMDAGLDGG